MQQRLADEATRLGTLIVSEPEADRPTDATPEAIATLNGLNAAIAEYVGGIAVDNA